MRSCGDKRVRAKDARGVVCVAHAARARACVGVPRLQPATLPLTYVCRLRRQRSSTGATKTTVVTETATATATATVIGIEIATGTGTATATAAATQRFRRPPRSCPCQWAGAGAKEPLCRRG